MKIKIVSILLLLNSSLFSQISEEQEIYHFINSTINKSTSEFNLKDKFGEYTYSVEYLKTYFSDSIFSQKDRDTFLLQLKKNENFVWNEDFIPNSKVIKSREIKKIFRKKIILAKLRKEKGWDKFNKKYEKCLTTFSIPLFSANMQYCIFFQWTQCDYLAGGGSLKIYINKAGKWEFYDILMTGMS